MNLLRQYSPLFLLVSGLLLTGRYICAQPLWAGAAQTNITPPLGTLINGGFESEYATSVHDSLFAKAIVLRSGKKTVAFVVVDICEMLRDFIDATKQQVYRATGIPPADILIASTHAHSAGAVESDFLASADLPYRKKLPGLIVSVVRAAQQRLQYAELSVGYVAAPEHVRVRRYLMRDDYIAVNPVSGLPDRVKTNPGGATPGQILKMVAQPDTNLSFVAIRSVGKKWIAVLGNYSMHYVGDWPPGTLTADYFGVFAHALKTQLGANDDFVGILSNGTSGDANIEVYIGPDPYPKEPFQKSERIGTDLAMKVAAVLPAAPWQTNVALKSAYRDVPLRVRKPSADELARAQAVVKTINFREIGKEAGAPYLQKLYAFEQTMLAAYPDRLTLPVQAFQVGNAIIGGLPGEIFSETGLWLKQHSPASFYFTIGLANDYPGYIPPAHEIRQGGYETWRCRTSCLEEQAEAVLRNSLHRLVVNMYRHK